MLIYYCSAKYGFISSHHLSIGHTMQHVIQQLVGGMRSGLSYSGVKNLKELRRHARYMVVTSNSVAESKPHLLTR